MGSSPPIDVQVDSSEAVSAIFNFLPAGESSWRVVHDGSVLIPVFTFAFAGVKNGDNIYVSENIVLRPHKANSDNLRKRGTMMRTISQLRKKDIIMRRIIEGNARSTRLLLKRFVCLAEREMDIIGDQEELIFSARRDEPSTDILPCCWDESDE